ncbi:MAG: amidophosphoribosyltransferase [Planctomycetes bacterium]|nr:amidophosphoribosyltransferase [Planctomycetota bacterium]
MGTYMCGIFGVYNHKEAVELTKLGLYALQHRGQESVGIAFRNGGKISRSIKRGLVQDVLEDNQFKVQSSFCIGHTRYSTTGGSDIINAQPIVADTPYGQISIAHNGNLTNSLKLRGEYFDKKGYIAPVIFHSKSDTELILWIVASLRKENAFSALKSALKIIKGSFSLIIMTNEQLIALRDPNGFRPLCLGELDKSYALSSEPCALDVTGFKFVRDLEPGEMICIDKKGLSSLKYSKPKLSFCGFEYVYFARPDSHFNGITVNDVRKELGMELARESPVAADIVTSVPDSGNAAALGYSTEAGIPFEFCFIRNHYVGRTFIEPSSIKRELDIRIKLSPIKSVVKGKKIIVVDDSIVRGNTVKNRVNLLRESGAKEIHLRISCPPIKYPCVYGIDFPDPNELIANTKSLDEIAKYVCADSLRYLSLDGMKKVIKTKSCFACWDNKYPVIPEDEPAKFKF